MENLTTRNGDISDIFAMLTERNARKIDVVAPASTLVSHKGNLMVRGAEAEITLDGVTTVDGTYTPNTVGIEGIASKLDIPIKYARRLHADRPDLWDANVNGWLRGGINKDSVVAPGDPRTFLLRAFRSDDGGPGILRALLSDSYKMLDDLDTAVAVLDGLKAAGLDASRVKIKGDISERRMRLRVVCPEVQALAPTLLKGYRSPYSGQTGDENPTIFAGLEFGNSETGNGAWTIVPRMEVQVCTNGLTITKDALRNVHLGSKLETGVVRWSEETQQRNLDLVRSQTVDAVKTFLDVDYMTKAIEVLERKAGHEVESVDAVRNVTKKAGFTEVEIEATLAMFIKGGQMTLGGIVNAATAASQQFTDGDAASDLDVKAMALLA